MKIYPDGYKKGDKCTVRFHTKVDFGKYTRTLSKIRRVYALWGSDFDYVGEKYKLKLLIELKYAIEHLKDLEKEIE